MPDKKTLKNFSFFSGIEEAQLDALARCTREITVNAGETLYRAGETADHLYGVITGRIELSLVFSDKVLKADIRYEEVNRSRIEVLEKPVQVATADGGKIFGWSALARRRQRTLSAICETTGRLIALPSGDLRRLFEKDSALGYRLMCRLYDLTYERLEDRTEKLIMAWVEAFGANSV
jgi:CRP-like cAMP-binding protein